MLLQDLLHAFLGMTEVLHWLPIASRIKFKVLLLVSKSQLGQAPLAISLTLCADQCLQHLPAFCALLTNKTVTKNDFQILSKQGKVKCEELIANSNVVSRPFKSFCSSFQDCLGSMSRFCCDWSLLLEWPPSSTSS